MLTAPSNGITENGCILYTTKTTKTRSFARKTRQAPNEKRQGFPCLAVTEGCGRAALLFPVGTSARLLLLSSRFHHLQCLFGVRNQRAVGEPGDELLEFPDGGVPLSGSRKVHGRLELRQFLLGHALAAFLSLPVELGLSIFRWSALSHSEKPSFLSTGFCSCARAAPAAKSRTAVMIANSFFIRCPSSMS